MKFTARSNGLFSFSRSLGCNAIRRGSSSQKQSFPVLFVSHYNSTVKRSTRSFFLLATVTAFGALVPHLAGYGNTALHFNFGRAT